MRLVVILLLAAPAIAVAQPAGPILVSDDDAIELRSWSEDVRPLKSSHALAVGETFGMILGLNAGAQLADRPWADISFDSVKTNLTSSWAWDEDAFTIDQLGHPYGGAWPFLAARSTGHGFWVSAAYSVGASLVWELFMETETPSINDQITTPIAGALLGESLHRIGRALRTGNPGIVRTAFASVLDPVGAVNRKVWGKAWRDKLPPSYYAHVGIGWEKLTMAYQGRRPEADQDQFHAELVLQHGLPADPDFTPRLPLDHFDLRAAVDVSSETFVGTVDVRGMVIGRKVAWGAMRGVYGMYGTYDYMNPDRVRVSAIGVGPGIATETALGSQDFVRATAVVAFVPWGAAGGSNESETMRDYHRGPGAAQIVELELGRRNVGALRLTSRAWEIDGTQTGDGRELVTTHTLGGRVALAANHAIGAEGTYSLRAAEFTPEDMSLMDRTVELRVYYALTSSN